ncbi:Glyoxalase-like domain-containing protein [Fulvimarina manganoxydans]|uniref:Glyoxalase-like domain-containing protein n=2 Tax=Fulvimarina manganoxydans TaxID=937218 RepID=A0A1W2DPF1_9HYPH|nr:Glyoxalase-like domain-containing protein [Fulvimarina manganoxydans]
MTRGAKMRALDHLVLPFIDLAQARDWFSRLGFTVAPDARHPFGTENACVFFADGTFFEPLAIGSAEDYARALEGGNLFVERDEGFRSHAPDAVSAIALKSSDALADQAHLRASQLGEDRLTEFERDLTLPSGEAARLSFRLAFAKSFGDQTPTVFFCEARHRLSVDRSALLAHANGAMSITGVDFEAGDLERATRHIEAVFCCEAQVSPDRGIVFDLAETRVTLAPAQEGSDKAALRVAAVTVGVDSLSKAEACLTGSDIPYSADDETITVAFPNGDGRLVFVEEPV